MLICLTVAVLLWNVLLLIIFSFSNIRSNMKSQLAALSDALHGVNHHHEGTNDDYYDKG